MEVPDQVTNPVGISYWIWYITYQKIEISISGILSHSFRRNSVFHGGVLFWSYIGVYYWVQEPNQMELSHIR